MADQPTNDRAPTDRLDFAEAIPRRLRTWLYAFAVFVGITALAVGEIVPIWFPDIAEQITQTENRVLGLVTIVTGMLGTAYRPSTF